MNVDAMGEKLDRFFDAIEAGDPDAARDVYDELAHPDATFESAVGSAIEGGKYRGRQEVMGYIAGLMEGFELGYGNRRYEWLDPGTLLVTYDFAFKNLRTGLELEYPVSALSLLRDGKVTETKTFQDPEAAREAAGA